MVAACGDSGVTDTTGPLQTTITMTTTTTTRPVDGTPPTRPVDDRLPTCRDVVVTPRSVDETEIGLTIGDAETGLADLHVLSTSANMVLPEPPLLKRGVKEVVLAAVAHRDDSGVATIEVEAVDGAGNRTVFELHHFTDSTARLSLRVERPDTPALVESLELRGSTTILVRRLGPSGEPEDADGTGQAEFVVEMVALSLKSIDPVVVLVGDPGWDVTVTLDPDRPSTGQAELTELTGNGHFLVDSFFDVFYQIELDGRVWRADDAVPWMSAIPAMPPTGVTFTDPTATEVELFPIEGTADPTGADPTVTGVFLSMVIHILGPPATEPPPTTQATTVEVTEASYEDLEVGDCFNEPGPADPADWVEIVPCELPHDSEMYARIPHPAGPSDPYPGEDELYWFADEPCIAALDTYLGVSPDTVDLSDLIEVLGYYAMVPDQASWEDISVRDIMCIAFAWNEHKLEGSLRDAGE